MGSCKKHNVKVHVYYYNNGAPSWCLRIRKSAPYPTCRSVNRNKSDRQTYFVLDGVKIVNIQEKKCTFAVKTCLFGCSSDIIAEILIDFWLRLLLTFCLGITAQLYVRVNKDKEISLIRKYLFKLANWNHQDNFLLQFEVLRSTIL